MVEELPRFGDQDGVAGFRVDGPRWRRFAAEPVEEGEPRDGEASGHHSYADDVTAAGGAVFGFGEALDGAGADVAAVGVHYYYDITAFGCFRDYCVADGFDVVGECSGGI